MSAPSNFGALGPGAISIVAEIADDRICSVRVASSRPTNLPRLFIGRPAQEIPILAERLYSLCGLSHAVAATRAIAAARGEAPAPQCGSLGVGLLCERVSESLRSSATTAANGGAASALDASALRPLREILSLTRELATLAMAPAASTAASRAAFTHLIARIRAAVGELGLDGPDASPRKGSWFGDLWKEMGRGPSLAVDVPDALADEDDAAILDGLRQAGEGFAAAPRLAGRTPETGAFARHWRDVDFSAGALPARLQARMVDLSLSLERLSRAGAGEADESGARSAAPAPREGFAAVQTSRGDLYHWARLSPDGRISHYAIVAPTEWNFHPAGPFVAALLGARVPRGAALQSIARLAGLFDPCVVFRVDVPEAARA
ncbi:MAG: nickel-dependent hydrogenase large subunit [Methylocystaceae bacterium]|nr:MAG: nickel-dependent hydrogenase large subunit [Methylocystaceae bacterium]